MRSSWRARMQDKNSRIISRLAGEGFCVVGGMATSAKFLLVAGLSGAIAWWTYRKRCARQRPANREGPVEGDNQRLTSPLHGSTPEEIENYVKSVGKKEPHKLESLFAICKSPGSRDLLTDVLLRQVLKKMADILSHSPAKPRFLAALIEHCLGLIAARPDVASEAADVVMEAARDKLRHGVDVSDLAIAEIVKLLGDQKLSTSLAQRLLRAVFYLAASKENATRMPLTALLAAVAAHRNSNGVLIDGLNALTTVLANTTAEISDLQRESIWAEAFSIAKTSDNAEAIWRALDVLITLKTGDETVMSHAQIEEATQLSFAALARHGVKHRQVAERALKFLVMMNADVAANKDSVDAVVAAHAKTVPAIPLYAKQLNR